MSNIENPLFKTGKILVVVPLILGFLTLVVYLATFPVSMIINAILKHPAVVGMWMVITGVILMMTAKIIKTVREIIKTARVNAR